MHSELGDANQRLSAELVKARAEADVSQPKLAERSGVSRNTVSDIERLVTLPSAKILRKLADGLATYAPGRTDAELAAAYYDRLMRAAGYIEDALTEPPPKPRPVEDLTDEEVEEALTRISNDPRFSAEMLATAADWIDYPPSARKAVLNGFELARQMTEDIKAAERRDASRPRRRPGS